jgi:hypothetical protein
VWTQNYIEPTRTDGQRRGPSIDACTHIIRGGFVLVDISPAWLKYYVTDTKFGILKDLIGLGAWLKIGLTGQIFFSLKKGGGHEEKCAFACEWAHFFKV